MKMRKRKYLVFGAILISVLMVLPVISGCAPKGAAPPEAEKAVAYLSLGDYTGPIAGLNVPADTGCDDFFTDFNERGGVDGVLVNFIGVDTRYDVARGVSAYKRYRTEPNLLVVNCISTPFGKAIAPMTQKDKVVQLAPGDGEFQAFPGWCFPWGPVYQNAFGATIDFIVEKWKEEGNAGMPTIGYLSWDSAYGREPLRGGKEYAEQVGVKLLEPEFFPVGAADHSVWLQRIAEKGADWCIIGGVDPTPANVLRDALKLGLMEQMQFVDATYWGPCEAVGIALHPEACEGAYMCSFYVRGDEAWDHPMIKVGEKYHPGVDLRQEFAGNYITGMGWGMTFEECLKRELDKYGYENINGETHKEAMESLTGLEVTQGMQGPSCYAPSGPFCRQGSNVVKFYQVQNGKEIDVSGWKTVPDCVSLYDWSE